MFFAYAINFNLFDYEAFIKHLNLEEFNGCYLHNEIQSHNEGRDRFLMDKSQIKFIRDNYKNGASFKVRVIFGDGDYMDGVFYYWYNETMGDRGLISTSNDTSALTTFQQRKELI